MRCGGFGGGQKEEHKARSKMERWRMERGRDE
jgi:hypothetical protein